METTYLPKLSQAQSPLEALHNRLIYLSPVPWHSFTQRPHELVNCFHQITGGQVLWVDPYPTRLPNLSDLTHRLPSIPTHTPVPDWLQLITPVALPIEPLPLSARFNRWLWRRTVASVRKFARQPALLVVGKPSHLALQLMADPLLRDSCYDAMDEISLFYKGYSRWAMARREQETILSARRVWCSSSALQHRLQKWGIAPQWVANACAVERLPEALSRPIKASNQAPLIGYVGTIAKWFDWTMVIALADARPNARILLIGPIFGAVPKQLRDNIELLPQCPHEEAVRAMSTFDVGLIPFKITRLTDAVDPIKYYEYRALGIAVISSAFGEMRHRAETDGVFLADDDTCLESLIQHAMAYRESLDKILHFRSTNAWSLRFIQAQAFVRRPATMDPYTTRPAALGIN